MIIFSFNVVSLLIFDAGFIINMFILNETYSNFIYQLYVILIII